MPNQPMTVNLTLPKELEDYVNQRVASGGHGSASEYLLELVRAEQLERERDVFEQELVLALEKKDFVPVDDDYWARLQQELADRRARRPQAGSAGPPGDRA